MDAAVNAGVDVVSSGTVDITEKVYDVMMAVVGTCPY
jgi:hypothetical protein